MTSQRRSEIIKEHPIRNGLDAFRASFGNVAIEHLDEQDLQALASDLLAALQSLPTSHLLRSAGWSRNLRSDLLSLSIAIDDGHVAVERIKPLLKSALADIPDDTVIWNQVYIAVTEPTLSPTLIPSTIQQTPLNQNTSSLVNLSEFRRDIDPILRSELKHLYVGLPNFHKAFFGEVPDLDTISEAVFRRCTEGDNPLFKGGWSAWPPGAFERDVLAWFRDLIQKLEAFAGDRISTLPVRRKLVAQPRMPLLGSIGRRSMDICFINRGVTYNPYSKGERYRWAQILVAGELNSNPKADIESMAWADLASYAREVFADQPTRRFVLGFTLCGSLMRVWEFDRIGGVASEQFDINIEHGGQKFVTTILGFLLMNEKMLGLDPTVITSGDCQYIDIQRNDKTERLIVDDVIKRARCIAGRATICWKAHRKEDPETPLVIKDSWQYTDRDEEGELLREAAERGVANVARYYHHETIRIGGADDDIEKNIRKGLDITEATNYRASASAGTKRPSSNIDAVLPPTKRRGSSSPTKPSAEPRPTNSSAELRPLSPSTEPPTESSAKPLRNRVHRRIIVQDYGKPIYKASSRVALLSALESCVKGHESLHKAGLLHRDISANNLIVNEDERSPSWPAFLIDLDLAILEQREVASGAEGKTGTLAFMSIGVLMGEKHSFMHDLESFFWVLFWICIHYDGPDKGKTVPRYEKWNYTDTDDLAGIKLGEIADESRFLRRAGENFTSYYQPLIPWVNRLRRKVFPDDRMCKRLEPELYSWMRQILCDAQKDPKVLGIEASRCPGA